jgi:hypothetical protein
MKKLSTLLFFVLFALVADAQYYYLPYLTANQNPGNVNQDVEQPTGAAGISGYTNIAATNASPAWSTTVFLPGDFTFLFNGNPVTEFKVSTSGVLTFTTSAVTPPTATNAALPSASIPNNSIMVWGLAGSGANDVIRTKMFGDYPNRQQWIQFASYSAPGSAGSNWTYWGIVLEETTNNIYIVDQRTYLTPLTLTLGIQINGSTAYTVTGAPNTPSLVTNGGNADTYEDNIYYKFIPGVQPTNDAELAALTFSNFGGAGANVDITGTVINVGTAPITSLTVKYLANGLIKSNIITGLNITTNATYDFTHNVPFTIPAPGTWPVKVWVETTGDANQTNDTLSQTISALAFQPTKRIVFEEGTGTWCQWCPRGAVFMDSIHNAYPTTALTIAVHNGDPMTVDAYDAGIASLIAGYPSGLVDRKGGEADPSEFFDRYDASINGFTPCDVDVDATWNAGTNSYDIAVSSKMATDLIGDYRFNVVVTEDGVKGTGSTWNQANAYSGGANGPMGGYESKPNPVPAAAMVYDHVGRDILGGFDGAFGSLPETLLVNTTHTYSTSYQVKAGENKDKMVIIAWVSSAATGEILNANYKSFNITGVSSQNASTFALNTFPNPSNGTTNFEVIMPMLTGNISLEIYDLMGRKVFATEDGSVNGGSKFFTWNADASIANGIYQAVIKVGDESVATKVVLTR